MIAINNQVFEEGDIVRFEHATSPRNRQRDYRITAVTPGSIVVTSGGPGYEYTAAEATRVGITHRTIEK